jgi:hypothetical protein
MEFPMLRKTGLVATALALVAAQTAPAVADDAWRHIYAPRDSTLAGVMDEDEVATMAYMRVPFGGPSHLRKGDVRYGVALASRLPDREGGSVVETERNVMRLVDLNFTADGFQDLRINGLSTRMAFERLNARAEGEPSAWWTYGLMALALGTVAVIVVANEDDGFTEDDAPPPTDN